MTLRLPVNAVRIFNPSAIPAVYFLMRSGRVMYVGQTCDLRRRLLSHGLTGLHGKFKHRRFGSAYAIVASPDRNLRAKLERKMIRRYKPRYNYPTYSRIPILQKRARWNRIDRVKNLTTTVDKKTIKKLLFVLRYLNIAPAMAIRIGVNNILPSLLQAAKDTRALVREYHAWEGHFPSKLTEKQLIERAKDYFLNEKPADKAAREHYSDFRVIIPSEAQTFFRVETKNTKT